MGLAAARSTDQGQNANLSPIASVAGMPASTMYTNSHQLSPWGETPVSGQRRSGPRPGTPGRRCRQLPGRSPRPWRVTHSCNASVQRRVPSPRIAESATFALNSAEYCFLFAMPMGPYADWLHLDVLFKFPGPLLGVPVRPVSPHFNFPSATVGGCQRLSRGSICRGVVDLVRAKGPEFSRRSESPRAPRGAGSSRVRRWRGVRARPG